mgnify:FL=1
MSVSLNEFENENQGTNGEQGTSASLIGQISTVLSKEIGGNKLKDAQKENFFSEMALLLEAGLNIKASLDLILDQTKKEKQKKIFSQIIENITQGMKFSESLKILPQFSDYEYYSIRIGEESGTLIKVLKGLANLLFY